MSIFNINFPNDGVYSEQFTDIGLWFSNERIAYPIPRIAMYDNNVIAFLGYISEAEYNLIVAEFGGYPNYELRKGYASVDYFGPPIRLIGSVPKGSIVRAPIYFKTNNIDVHKIVYLTQQQVDFLKTQNIQLANNAFYGPYRIPMYDYDEVGLNQPSASNWDNSGAPGASVGDAYQPAFTYTSGAVARDSSGRPITSGTTGGYIYAGNGDYNYGSDGGYQPRFRQVPVPFGPNSGVYTGSLSAQGNMVAMQLNPGQVNLQYNGGTFEVVQYHSGYFKEYWRDPSTTTFGANTQMPALTGVMPDKYTDMPGNAVYYVDLQMTRLSGSNAWENNFFINAFNQALGYTLISNSYLAALKTAESTDLAYYGADSYQVLTTQGFNKYQVGNALTLAFRNIGKIAREITSGYFGTANAVAKVMIDLGLGYINNLAVALYSGGVNFDDIGNEVYTPFITEQLRQITNATDLQTIQEVLESNIPNIANPLDYTRIDRSAGIPNDSEFDSFAAVGQDFYNRAPNLLLTTGAEIADLIDKIQSNVTANVEAVSSANALIRQDLVESLRSRLPYSPDNSPISILNVIGMSSGYLLQEMQKVNEGVAALYATDYGPQIRSTFSNISRYYAKVPLTTQEQSESAAWWDTQLEKEKTAYYTLIDTIMADTTGNIPAIVDHINTNYDNFTSNLYAEYRNYNLANIASSNFGDVTSTLAFIQSMPGYAADPDNVGTDLLLYGITQSNDGGEIARTVLDQGKNDFFLSNAGVTITGII
jgi:hypothetical protein